MLTKGNTRRLQATNNALYGFNWIRHFTGLLDLPLVNSVCEVPLTFHSGPKMQHRDGASHPLCGCHLYLTSQLRANQRSPCQTRPTVQCTCGPKPLTFHCHSTARILSTLSHDAAAALAPRRSNKSLVMIVPTFVAKSVQRTACPSDH